MSETRKQLERAFRLINTQKTDEALAILRPIKEQEPENPHVWWLMAYALDDPQQVREALITVLQLDPEYSNADRARELLASLNDQHPPTQEEIERFPDFLGQYSAFPDAFAAMGDVEDIFGDDPFSEFFDDQGVEPEAAEYYSDDEPFDESVFSIVDDDSFEEDIEEQPPKKSRKERRAERRAEKERQKAEKQRAKEAEAQMDDATLLAHRLGLDPEALDDDTLATLEERAARKPSRLARVGRVVLLSVLIAVIFVAAYSALPGGDTGADPGVLQMVEIADGQSMSGVAVVEAAVQAAGLGENSQVVIAKSDVGTTLFATFCSQPTAELAVTIMRGMDVVARESLAIQDEVDGIGISAERCSESGQDTLYRAYVPLQDALDYAAGTDTESARSAFQALWQTP